MKHYLTGHDIANTVRMAHTQRRITFLLVEGETDLLCLRCFISAADCEILVCHGRVNALQATSLLDKSRELGFVALVDADFDRLNGVLPLSDNCVFTDFHDLIVVLFCSSSLGKLLAERGSPDKIKVFETSIKGPVTDAILDRARPLGYLRWLNQRENLGLTFSDLNFNGLVEPGSLTFDHAKTVLTVAQRSNCAPLAADIQKRCETLTSAGHDARNLCSGHDLIALLSIGLRQALGSQRAMDVRPETLELELRLAFDAQAFSATEIRARLNDWEARNAGWKVLAM